VGLVQIPLLFAAATLDGWPLLVVALLMMMAIFGQIPLNDGIVGKYVSDEYRARVLSVRYVVSLGVAFGAMQDRRRLSQRVRRPRASRLRRIRRRPLLHLAPPDGGRSGRGLIPDNVRNYFRRAT